ncbi:MAG TPA: PQQ-dependent sugar dehydrogenase [Gammaproteobacteria bacterium]|nr:PQQ-dependent sugar dehydrogenase [Gammaproteobacteria bacterium]
MRHADVRRAAAASLLVFAIATARAQPPQVWPLDPQKLPGAIAGIPAGTSWPSPPLGPGPFLVESVRSEHRNLRVVVVARGLEQPWSIAFLPGGDMLVTERAGRLRLIKGGKLDPAPVAGIPAVRSRGLQGLMDVVLHPRFADNHFVYFSYHRPAGEDAGETMLARGRWENDKLVDVRDIFATGATGTEGSRIGFAKDGMLHMTVSAPGVGPDVIRSQNPKDYAGKTIRLRDDGSIPPDNPFVNDARYLPAIYTLGHRNGHSMVLNPWTGELWATEQGPNGGDEINILQKGGNYGWPLVSYGRVYSGPRVSANPTLEGTIQPIVFWVPSIAVTGLTFYQGDVFTAWRRSAFVGGLRQGEVPRTGQLQRIEFNDRWEEIRRETLLRELGQRIRDVREGPDGLLYVLTAEAPDGAVLRIEPAS